MSAELPLAELEEAASQPAPEEAFRPPVKLLVPQKPSAAASGLGGDGPVREQEPTPSTKRRNEYAMLGETDAVPEAKRKNTTGTNISNASADESACLVSTTGTDAGIGSAAKGSETSLTSVICKLLRANVNDDIKNSDDDKARWETELQDFYATPLSALFDEEIARINRAIGEEFKVMTPKGKTRQPHVRWTGVVFL